MKPIHAAVAALAIGLSIATLPAHAQSDAPADGSAPAAPGNGAAGSPGAARARFGGRQALKPVALTSDQLTTINNYVGSTSVNWEDLTWPELHKAIHIDGKTTALIFNGGTETRGIQGANGAHTFVARYVGQKIAQELGNAILAPVLPFSVNNAEPGRPGTIGVSGDLFADINEEVAEQLIRNGFKNIVLMGDHGGGQEQLEEVATKLDTKYAAQGIRVIYVGDVYRKAGTEIVQWLKDNNYPSYGGHANTKDTSELLSIEGDNNWVRKELLPLSIQGIEPIPGEPNATPEANGIQGDARPSTAEIGEHITAIKVKDAVAEIQRLLSTPRPAATTASASDAPAGNAATPVGVVTSTSASADH
jgi:creatinine amidohydrolase/Fe(II)-dependent formamide hydrolase-like protein